MFFPELSVYNFVFYRMALTSSEGPGFISTPDISSCEFRTADWRSSKVGDCCQEKFYEATVAVMSVYTFSNQQLVTGYKTVGYSSECMFRVFCISMIWPMLKTKL
jgi:hypothetical protein